MAYRIRSKDPSVEAAVRRIAIEQIDRAIASIDGKPRAEAIHDVRKRCKKLRALVRLVRPVFAGYEAENADFRDAARLISGARDAKVMQETYDLLMKHYGRQVNRRAMGSIRRRFTHERKQQSETGDTDARLGEVRGRLAAARERACAWSIAADGWEAIGPGLARTVARAREAADLAFTSRSAAAFHELRKHLKYHWHHTRLLANLWPAMMAMRSDALGELTEQLGLHHDLCVFERRLGSEPELYGTERNVVLATGLAGQMRTGIEDAARLETQRLLAQPPKHVARHWQKLWDAWRGTERADGAGT